MNLLFLPMFFLGLICLIYLGYQDLKSREINIVPLLVLSAIGFIYFIFFGLTNGFLYMYILQIAISYAFLTIIYVLGKFTAYAYIGEGDLLAIMAMSLMCGISVLFAPFVFLMATVLTLVLPISFFFYNLFVGNIPKKPIWESFLLMCFGFPKKLEKISDFYTPLEKYKIRNNKLISETIIKPNCSPEKQLYDLKKFAKVNNIERVWVSPLIPFIITLTIAYVIIGVLTYFNVLAFLGNFASSFI